MRTTADQLVLGFAVVLTGACGEADDGRSVSSGATGLTQGVTGGEDGEGDDGDGETGTGEDTKAPLDDDGGFVPKFDVASPDGDSTCGGGMGGEIDFSHIWVANSPQGTISKINTQTMQEQGRYIVRPDSAGSPSRTSVSLSGNVAVANRNGSVTKVFARLDDCVESNGVPGIQTSTNNVALPWDQEECRAWHTPMNHQTQRPVAWAPGVFNDQTCEYEDEKLWTTGAMHNAAGSIEVSRLNGDDGAVEDVVVIAGLNPGYYGPYGGAVDADGNFWFSMLGVGSLVRVDFQTLDYKVYGMPISGYGMTVDHEGRPWICGSGVARFDPMAETFDVQTQGIGSAAGCMGDGQGKLWLAGAASLRAIDTETMQLVQSIALPLYVHGTSVDFHGYVWGVSMSTSAYRVDPMAQTVDSYDGLNSPYSYSDMTGFALSTAGAPSG